MRQMILDIRPEAPPRLDNYLPGSNGEALATLRRLADTGTGEAILYLWGGHGTGKTHLLRATLAAFAPNGNTRAISPPAPLPDQLTGLLLVDDVQRLDEGAQVRLFDLINQAREGAGRIVATGDAPPQSLALRADLATRLAWGLVLHLHPLSDREKLAALRQRATARGMLWPEELGRHLLSHCRRDLPHLLAMVDDLDEYSLSRGRAPSLALAREFLREAG